MKTNIEVNLIKYIDNLTLDLKKYLHNSKIQKLVIGVSGGVDSAVALTILIKHFPIVNIRPYFIDILSDQNDWIDAQRICKHLKIKLNYLNLNNSFMQMQKELNIQDNIDASANLKSRMRMLSLYNEAFINSGLVIGNSNLSEIYLGYFTKFGDAACDYFLLSNFIKKDIYEIAKIYKLPKFIINKKPTSGLKVNLNDEQELKIKYKDLDQYLSFKKIDSITKSKIVKLHQQNTHKLTYNLYNNVYRKYRTKNHDEN